MSPPASRSVASTAAAGTASSTTNARSIVDGGYGDGGRTSGRGAAHASERTRGRPRTRRPRLDAVRRRHGGIHLAHGPDRLAVDHDPRDATGCATPGVLPDRSATDATRQRVEDDPHEVDRVVDVDRAGRARPGPPDRARRAARRRARARRAAPRPAPGGKNTVPSSNSATSGLPRAVLSAAARSRPGTQAPCAAPTPRRAAGSRAATAPDVARSRASSVGRHERDRDRLGQRRRPPARRRRRRRSRWSWRQPADLLRRASGRCARSTSKPIRRATSSTRSISRSRSGRNVGGTAARSSPLPSTSIPSGRRASSTSASVSVVPEHAVHLGSCAAWMRRPRRRLAGTRRRLRARRRAGRPRASSSIARAACARDRRRGRSHARSGRSTRTAASGASSCGRSPSARSTPTSSRISVVSSETSAVAPPMIPAIACGARLAVADEEVLGVERALARRRGW